MAVAPVLPWRKASLRAAARPAVLAGVVRRRRARRRRASSGRPGWARSSRSGSPGAAAGSALRQVVLATRRQGWRGLVGRANGGMIVHLGVIIDRRRPRRVERYTRSATLDLPVGEVRRVGRAHVRAAGGPSRTVDDRVRRSIAADVLLDGGRRVHAGVSRSTSARASTSARRACARASRRTST